MATTLKINIFENEELIAQALKMCVFERGIIQDIDSDTLDKTPEVMVRNMRTMRGLEKLAELQYVIDYCKGRNPEEHDIRIDGETLAAIREWGDATEEKVLDYYRDRLGLDVDRPDGWDDGHDAEVPATRTLN